MEKHAPRTTAYRPDIDGLRSLAILPVVFYHLKVSFVPGGFVGVDIFFVISGYLITNLISQQIHAGTYSIADFYHRRARRIFPALFFVIACCIGCALVTLLPYEVKSFKDSLIAATLFVSNIYFYETSDYFSQNAATIPLLHTWSLSVEEQFYIFFPLLLLLVRRVAGHLEKLTFVALALLSLAISVWLTTANATGAFYLLQSRAWELLIGSLLAINAVPAIRHRLAGEICGGIGLLCILGSVLFYTDKLPFPGWIALVPCIGAAFIIQSGKTLTTTTSRLLSTAPLRFIGLISYSLYLWHWPIDVFAQTIWTGEFGKVEKAGILGVGILCATLSWHFVEKPFRHPPYRLRRNQILGLSGAVMAVLVGLGLVMMPLSTARWNLPEDVTKTLAVVDVDWHTTMRVGTCFLNSDDADRSQLDQDDCLKISTDKPNVLLIGDSHGAHLWAGLHEVFPNVNFLEATAAGCKPVDNPIGQRHCTALMHFVFDDYLPKHHVDAIIISARWKDFDLAALLATTQHIKGFADKIIVMGPTVEYRGALPRLVAMSMIKQDPSVVERGRLAEQQRTDAQFDAALRGTDVRYFSVYHAICPDDHCTTLSRDGLPMSFDYGHFTRNGSIFVAERIKAAGLL